MGQSLHRVSKDCRLNRRHSSLWVVAAAALAVAVDQATKYLVRQRIDVGEVISVFPGFDLRHVHNTGVAFGLLSDGGRAVLVLTIFVALVLLAFLIRMANTVPVALGAGLIAGGAIGNIVDRARLGHVTDFLHVPHWPTFNLADTCIVVGVATVIWYQGRPRAARD